MVSYSAKDTTGHLADLINHERIQKDIQRGIKPHTSLEEGISVLQIYLTHVSSQGLLMFMMLLRPIICYFLDETKLNCITLQLAVMAYRILSLKNNQRDKFPRFSAKGGKLKNLVL